MSGHPAPKKKHSTPTKEIHFHRAFPDEVIGQIAGDDDHIHDFLGKVRDNWAHIPHIARKDVPIMDLIGWFQFTKTTLLVYNHQVTKNLEVTRKTAISAWRGVFIALIWGQKSTSKNLPKLWELFPKLKEIQHCPQILKAITNQVALQDAMKSRTDQSAPTERQARHERSPNTTHSTPTKKRAGTTSVEALRENSALPDAGDSPTGEMLKRRAEINRQLAAASAKKRKTLPDRPRTTETTEAGPAPKDEPIVVTDSPDRGPIMPDIAAASMTFAATLQAFVHWASDQQKANIGDTRNLRNEMRRMKNRVDEKDQTIANLQATVDNQVETILEMQEQIAAGEGALAKLRSDMTGQVKMVEDHDEVIAAWRRERNAFKWPGKQKAASLSSDGDGLDAPEEGMESDT